jgi:hypothetical protein
VRRINDGRRQRSCSSVTFLMKVRKRNETETEEQGVHEEEESQNHSQFNHFLQRPCRLLSRDENSFKQRTLLLMDYRMYLSFPRPLLSGFFFCLLMLISISVDLTNPKETRETLLVPPRLIISRTTNNLVYHPSQSGNSEASQETGNNDNTNLMQDIVSVRRDYWPRQLLMKQPLPLLDSYHETLRQQTEKDKTLYGVHGVKDTNQEDRKEMEKEERDSRRRRMEIMGEEESITWYGMIAQSILKESMIKEDKKRRISREMDIVIIPPTQDTETSVRHRQQQQTPIITKVKRNEDLPLAIESHTLVVDVVASMETSTERTTKNKSRQDDHLEDSDTGLTVITSAVDRKTADMTLLQGKRKKSNAQVNEEERGDKRSMTEKQRQLLLPSSNKEDTREQSVVLQLE